MKDSIELARRLARIARENDLAEIDYEHRGTRIHLVLEAPAQESPGNAPPVVAPGLQPLDLSPAPPPSEPGETVRSPLAGVFYRAPRPGAPPFVEVGQEVAAGQTLCIVEAMKLMNEITAELACRVQRILVTNETVVDTGQPLFLVEAL